MVFEVRFPSLVFELTCLSPFDFCCLVNSQKVGRRVEHHISRRDRCGQKEGFSLVSAECGDFFKSQTFQYVRNGNRGCSTHHGQTLRTR